jgi:hypothetical protein
VDGNTATSSGAVGGGIYTGGDLVVNATEVASNTATSPGGGASGAGLFVAGGSSGLTDSTVTQNRAVAPMADGGGILLVGAAQVTLTRTSVVQNVPDNCSPQGSIAGCSG